jgi:hypothetical protein
MKRALSALLAIALAAGTASLVCACLASMPRHEVSDQAAQIDSIPPGRPDLELIGVSRGKGPEKLDNGNFRYMSTDDLGTVGIRVLSLTDDQTPNEQIGLRVINLNGASEIGNQMVPGYDFRPFRFKQSEYPQIYLSWIDGSEDKQEPIAEEFAVYAIDSAGNVSVEADTVVVMDAGRP